VVLVPLKLATLLATPAALLAALLAVEFVLHYHIDWAKEQIAKPLVERRGAGYWATFGFDQFLHQATYVAIAYFLFRV